MSAIDLMTRRAERVMLAGVIDYRLRPVEAGDSAALFDLHRATMRTYLSRIELSPELQNLGLGAAIIEGLIDLGACRECALALDVFDVNPARRLYERLGFHQIGVSGQKVHMRRAHS